MLIYQVIKQKSYAQANKKKAKGNKQKIDKEFNTFEPIPLMINWLGICPRIS